MELVFDNSKPSQWISHCDHSEIRVGDQRFRAPLFIDNDRYDEWPLETLANLQFDTHIAPFLSTTTEIILLGTGDELRWPSTDIQQHCADRGVGFEVMTTAAACRTFNLLAQDQRQVAAFLWLSM